ncbi:ABC transporter ATP-binding protein [Streptomyces sp. XM4193]|uniref:ABC transporter ATP-binding protein n=1 Tax=Streptomyces sp. XM4193 TaxID=2929782 RepID=UPI001FFAA46B|nr:ABC transporter ATP-binding protein [Streptomyces sp. XM4193]MCK1796752.1 ABC transporter ATP-binding protein [Streptomyces sp. XM4193]
MNLSTSDAGRTPERPETSGTPDTAATHGTHAPAEAREASGTSAASGTADAPGIPGPSDGSGAVDGSGGVDRTVLRLTGVSHTYAGGRRRTAVLKNIDYAFARGTFYTVLGPSGSGKTTLLSLASGLDAPTAGSISFDGRDLAELGLGRYRNRHAATIFQQYNLLTYMTALQNVTTAMEITGAKPSSGSRRARALELLQQVGLDRDMARSNVLRLSGGQQQRVAIARALACDVDILFADEPTGNLDEDTAQGIVEIFRELAHEQGKCVVVVSHAQQVAAQSDRVLTLRKGRLSEQVNSR